MSSNTSLLQLEALTLATNVATPFGKNFGSFLEILLEALARFVFTSEKRGRLSRAGKILTIQIERHRSLKVDPHKVLQLISGKCGS